MFYRLSMHHTIKQENCLGALIMVVVSFKMSTAKICIALALLAVVIVAVAWPRNRVEAKEAGLAELSPGQAAADVSTNDKRVAYIESFGWKIDEQPAEVVELKIPETFDTVYNRYNTLQKRQGFDLTRYRGLRVKRYTYNIKNYPSAQTVRANILVYANTVVGGDVSSTALNGFMNTLNSKSTANADTGITVAQADPSQSLFSSGG